MLGKYDFIKNTVFELDTDFNLGFVKSQWQLIKPNLLEIDGYLIELKFSPVHAMHFDTSAGTRNVLWHLRRACISIGLHDKNAVSMSCMHQYKSVADDFAGVLEKGSWKCMMWFIMKAKIIAV